MRGVISRVGIGSESRFKEVVIVLVILLTVCWITINGRREEQKILDGVAAEEAAHEKFMDNNSQLVVESTKHELIAVLRRSPDRITLASGADSKGRREVICETVVNQPSMPIIGLHAVFTLDALSSTVNGFAVLIEGAKDYRLLCVDAKTRKSRLYGLKFVDVRRVLDPLTRQSLEIGHKNEVFYFACPRELKSAYPILALVTDPWDRTRLLGIKGPHDVQTLNSAFACVLPRGNFRWVEDRNQTCLVQDPPAWR